MHKLQLLAAGLVLGLALAPRARAQSLDPGFTPATFYAPGTVFSALEQPDGKKVVVGTFSRANGAASAQLVRFNADGSVDAAFQQKVGQVGPTYRVALQPNGQLLLTSFTGTTLTAGGLSRNSLLRLNADGSADPTFDVGVGPTTSQAGNLGSVDFALPLPNGQVLATGFFDHFGGAVANGVVRLDASGMVDATFNPGGSGPNDYVEGAVRLASGKFLVSGYFTIYNGTARHGLARLNPDGTLDTTFDPSLALGNGSSIDNFAVQPDGRILVAGYISPAGGVVQQPLVRLLNDGGADNSFTAPAIFGLGSIYSFYGNAIEVQADGKILVASHANSYGPVNRLNADGSLDASFQTRSVPGFNLFSLTLLSTGALLEAGNYFILGPNSRNALVQFASTGAVDLAFQPTFQLPGTVNGVAQQADGKILAIGNFSEVSGQASAAIARFNLNGTLDATYGGGTALSAAAVDLALQPDGRLLVLTSTSVQRLLATGTPDNSFAAPTTLGLELIAARLLLQTDGRVLVGGEVRNSTTQAILRLLDDGSRDASFAPLGGPGTSRFVSVQSLALQADGKILTAGIFCAAGSTTFSRTVQRLESTGAFDPAFAGGNFTLATNTPTLNSLAVQADGKVLVGGAFSSYAGMARANIARLNTDGSLDTGFAPPATASGSVSRVLPQPNGRVLLGGSFTAAGLPNNLGRLLATGAADATFAATALPNGTVRALLVQPDGKIVAGGSFTTISGQPSMSLARISAPNVLHVAAPQAVADRTEAWPVPAHATLTVAPDASAHPQAVELLDLLGRAVLRQSLSGATLAVLSLETLRAGTYLLRVNYAEGLVLRRVQVQ